MGNYRRNRINMNELIKTIGWTLKLYSLTLVIPLTLSLCNILFCGIIGVESNFGFLGNFKVIWVDYYITGHVGDFIAWRIHLGLLFFAFLFVMFEEGRD